jgi:hypothetical protein
MLSLLVLAAGCSGAPGEEEQIDQVGQALTTYQLYLRCNATSWDLNNTSKLQPTTDPYLFTVDFEVRQPWMVSDRDTCWVTDNTNGYKDYGAQTAGVVQVPAAGTVWSRLGTTAGQLQFKYPALGFYRATVNWRDGYIGIHPLKGQTYLQMRLSFSDDPVGYTPQSDASAISEANSDRQSFYRWSAGQVVIRTAVTPTIRLPYTRAHYLTGPCDPNVNPLWYSLIDDALTGARSLGFNPDDFNVHSTRFTGEPLCGSTSWGGGANTWLLWDGVTFHEWAHNLGLGANESSVRSKTSQVLNPDTEYEGDNVFSAVHNNDPNSVWTVPDLRNIGVLGEACLIRPTTTGTYRIYTHQVSALTFNPNQPYAIELRDGNGTRPFTFEYHHLIPANIAPSAVNGLVVLDSNSFNLIDTTPRSRTGEDDRLDTALLLGRSLPSVDGKWIVKPKARGGSGEFSYMDVEVVFTGK